MFDTVKRIWALGKCAIEINNYSILFYARPYHPSSGSHGQLFSPHKDSSARRSPRQDITEMHTHC